MTGTLRDLGAATRPVAHLGGPDQRLSAEQVEAFVRDQLAGGRRRRSQRLPGRSPTAPAAARFRCCCAPCTVRWSAASSRLTVLVALGTHAAMDEPHLAAHLGYQEGELDATYPGLTVLNHEWWDPTTFVSLGSISADRIAELSDGRAAGERRGTAQPRGRRARRRPGRRAGVSARGRRLLGRQQVLLPRRGRPGGHRPLALARRPDHQRRDHRHPRHHPGARADQRGRGDDPDAETRAVRRRRVRRRIGLHSVSFGDAEPSWAAAADVSAQTHVRYLDAPVRRVLSIMPAKYDDIWTGGEGLLQGRAGGGRRRRGDPLRTAHHARSRRCIPRSTRSATTAATTS